MRRGSTINRILFVLTVFIMIKGNIFEDIKIQYFVIGQPVNITCTFTPPASIRWRRNERIISQSGKMKEFPGSIRFRVMNGNFENVLHILKATEQDIAEYRCEIQTSSGTNVKKITLELADTILTTDIEDSTTILTTVPRTEQTSKEQTTKVVTDSSKDLTNDKTDSDKDKGLSFRETFFYGLLGAGLVLVLCLSVMCNTCINRRCKHDNKRNVPNDNATKESTDVVSQRSNESPSPRNMEEYSSPYELINEYEMLPDNIAAGHSSPKPPKTATSSKPHNSYLEIIDDNSYLTPCVATEIEEQNRNLKNTNTKRMDKTVTKSSSDSGDKIDEYLHPYVPLNQNDMEYLSSYSTTKTTETNKGNDLLGHSLEIHVNDRSFIQSEPSLYTNDENNLQNNIISNSISKSYHDISDYNNQEKFKPYDYTDASSSKVTSDAIMNTHNTSG